MRTRAKLKNFTSADGKIIILRNLSRIMNIRIVDLDENNNEITFLHDSLKTVEKVKRELKNIGFPAYHVYTNSVYSSHEAQFHSKAINETFA